MADHDPDRLVSWGRTGRRMRRTAFLVAGGVLAAWVGLGLASGGLEAGLLGNLSGLGVAVIFAAEIVFVGGSAVRGMLRAGERGERLARGDVGLLPARIRRPDDS